MASKKKNDKPGCGCIGLSLLLVLGGCHAAYEELFVPDICKVEAMAPVAASVAPAWDHRGGGGGGWFDSDSDSDSDSSGSDTENFDYRGSGHVVDGNSDGKYSKGEAEKAFDENQDHKLTGSEVEEYRDWQELEYGETEYVDDEAFDIDSRTGKPFPWQEKAYKAAKKRLAKKLEREREEEERKERERKELERKKRAAGCYE